MNVVRRAGFWLVGLAVVASFVIGWDRIGGALRGLAGGGAAPTAEPYEQRFTPPYLEELPPGDPIEVTTRIERARLAPDGLELTIDFVGGPGYSPADFCSDDYVPLVRVRGGILEVAMIVVHPAGQATFPPNTACALAGHIHTYHLGLAEAYHGTTIQDIGRGGTFIVGALPDTSHLAKAPAGWTLQAAFQQDAGPPPTWVEILAAGPVPDPRPGEGPGRLVLYQTFGISPEWTDTRAEKSRQRGGAPEPVTFRGEHATVWVDKESGELLLAWDLEGRSYGLIGNLADMTVDQLVSYAESVTIAE